MISYRISREVEYLIVTEMTSKIEILYNKFLLNNKIEHDISNIDFLGLNIFEKSQELPVEFKAYYQPQDITKIRSEDPEVIHFLYENNMVKFRCPVSGTRINRSYVVLKNLSYLNLKNFKNKLLEILPSFEKKLEEIPAIIPKKKNLYLPIHILAIKLDGQYGDAINLEWMLRDYLDYEANIYKYNDEYYISYIESLKSKDFNYLITFIKKMYGDAIKVGRLHLWLMGIDYFTNDISKYKLYLKIDEYNLQIPNLLREYFEDNNCTDIIIGVNEFIKIHCELKLYGIAICIDTNRIKSINMYFISSEK